MPKKNQPVTPFQKKMILKWTREGVLQQKTIARILQLTPAAVWKVQKQLGVRQYVPDRELPKGTEMKIAALLRKQWTGTRIQRELGIGPRHIARIARQSRHRRRRGSVGCAYRLRKPEITRIRQAITQSENQICKRFRVSRWWLRKFRAGSFSRKRKRV